MKIKVAGTPVPNRDIEQRSSGCGPVITYRLTEEELKKMREKEGPACGLTRQALLEAIAAGETLSGVERAWGMKYNTIHFWVKKWGLKGITPDKARELLKQEPADSEKEVPADSVSDPREKLAGDYCKQESPESVTDDPVNHPAHYTAGKVECIDAIEAATTGLDGFSAYCTGCAIKYLWRWNRKGGVEDLRKALWYVDRLIGYACYQRLGQKE